MINTPHIDQCNAIVRELYRSHRASSLFVDLDSMMTGTMNEVFRDVAHVTEAGRRFKAEQLGAVILDHWRRGHLSRSQDEESQ